MYLFSHWPPPPLSLCNFFFEPPPPFRFSFLSSILYHTSSLSFPGGVRRITSTVPYRHLTPLIFFLPICNHMIFDRADRVRGRRQEGRREEGEGLGRGMKNVKILKGGKKRKIFARAPLREEEGDKGREGFGLPPPCSPSLIWKAGCNHFEKCVDPSTVIIIEKKWKNSKTFYANRVRRWDKSSSFFSFFFFFFCLRTPPPPFPTSKSGT